MMILGRPLEDIINGALIIIVTICSFFGIKKGIKSQPETTPEKKTVEVAGALVDNRAVDKLAGEISGQTLAQIEFNQLMKQLIKRVDDWFEMQERREEELIKDRIDQLERENERLRANNERRN